MITFPKTKLFLMNDREELGYIDRRPLCRILDFILNVYLKSTLLPDTHTHTHTHTLTLICKVKINSTIENIYKKEEMIVLQASSLHSPHPSLQAYRPEVTLGLFPVVLIHISFHSDLTWNTVSWAQDLPEAFCTWFFLRTVCNLPLPALLLWPWGKGEQVGCMGALL